MKPEEWTEIERLCHGALEREGRERNLFLQEACAGNEALRRKVESLLAREEETGSLPQAPVLQAAPDELLQKQARFLVGRQLGSYLILSLLGEGGMGEVYRAEDTKLGREVALKVLPEAFTNDPERLARFEREARLLASLKHPNIITIHDVERIGSTHYIVMEQVEGRTLREVLAGGPMPIHDVLQAAAQIAAGVAEAHRNGIIHRDLKPGNVMVTKTGLVKILDFGSGKAALPVHQLDTQTTMAARFDASSLPGTILGTVNYMSPEQAAGRDVDFRSDQFSLGSLLYEMLTGMRAFDRETAPQTLNAIIEDEPRAIESVIAGIPVALQTIIRRCLAKDPQQRYGSTDELEGELRQLRDQFAEGKATSLPLALPRNLRRWRMALGLLLTAMLAAAGVWTIAPGIPERVRERFRFQPVRAEKQLAVLPFTNVGGDPANQAFSDGLVETLTSKLTQLERFHSSLQVVPASEVRREGITSAREARQAFGITLAVTGSVQRAGESVRLTINLVDAQTLRQLEARSIDTEVRDISVLQDGVVMQVTELLGVNLPSEARQILAAGATAVPGAFEFYLQGRGYLERFEDVDNVENAIGLFQRALAQDPKYALAHAALCEAFWRKYEYTKDTGWVDQARISCQRAIQLNDQLAAVHVTLGMIDIGTGRYEDAVEKLRQALRIDPLHGGAYRELANAYHALSKLQEAETTYKKAIEIRPGYWVGYNDLGRFYYRSARYGEAAAQYRRVIELTPDNPRGYNSLGAMYLQLRRYEDAKKMFERSLAIKPNESAYTNLGVLYVSQHRYSEGARTYERIVSMNDRNYVYWFNLAAAYYWAPGEREKARSAYERATQLAEQERQVNPRRPSLLMDLADCYSMLGQPDRARVLLKQALSLAPDDVPIMVDAGIVYEQLGDREHALEWIGKALHHGYPRDRIESSPSLAQLRADPGFQALQ